MIEKSKSVDRLAMMLAVEPTTLSCLIIDTLELQHDAALVQVLSDESFRFLLRPTDSIYCQLNRELDSLDCREELRELIFRSAIKLYLTRNQASVPEHILSSIGVKASPLGRNSKDVCSQLIEAFLSQDISRIVNLKYYDPRMATLGLLINRVASGFATEASVRVSELLGT